MTHTYTYVLMELSDAAYDEIRKKLEDAGYDEHLHDNPDDPARPRLNMHGIAVVPYRPDEIPTK